MWRGERVQSVLLVEDDASVRESVSLALEDFGYTVTSAASGHEALAMWKRPLPDLILLDVMLPGISGVEVCRTIRRESRLPVIMLTARTDPIDVVLGLESGADDYVTKPFETRVLVARVDAVLRRATPRPDDLIVRFGDLHIDRAGLSVTKAGRVIYLTPTELRLLLVLAKRPAQVLTRALLLELVWERGTLGDSRIVDVHVQRLRAKVEDDPSEPRLIRTVRGVGYKLVAPE
jgi:two-component system, OmpR family, response regulator MtrA